MPLQPPSPFHQHIALPERTALLLSMLAPWPRRGRELLVIGCGAGHVLPPLWQSGFDLSACETSPALREQARRRAPQGVEIEAASPD
ncbi:class I SAM-dependent methyltransferase [Desulfovibrio sp.]